MNLFLFSSLLLLALSSLEVFIVPHSHNDVGWLFTADQYYDERTHTILNNMYDILRSDPIMKFVWAESAYLSMWLRDYPEKKLGFKQLVDEGRLEIIGGGWTQNDEANPDFELVIRQMADGYNFLKKELNLTRIRTGWQIDPFGHSSLTPALWEKMGYESLTMLRVPDPLYKVSIHIGSNAQQPDHGIYMEGNRIRGDRRSFYACAEQHLLCPVVPGYRRGLP